MRFHFKLLSEDFVFVARLAEFLRNAPAHVFYSLSISGSGSRVAIVVFNSVVVDRQTFGANLLKMMGDCAELTASA